MHPGLFRTDIAGGERRLLVGIEPQVVVDLPEPNPVDVAVPTE